MEFRILGTIEVVEDGRVVPVPSGQQRLLLAFLVLNANRVVSPDRLADAVWGERLPETGTKALAFHVSRLRDALAPGRPGGSTGGLDTEPGGYVLRVHPDDIDAVRFERLGREAHDLLHDNPAQTRAILTEALALWRGDALADVAYADFAQPEIHRLDELRVAAVEDRLEADLALGEHASAGRELEALVAGNPLRERARGLLMLALYRSGRQAEALRVAGAGRRILSEELGIDPSPELVQLEARILAQDPSLATPGGVGHRLARARNPYKGLRAFDEADSRDFFGREALVGRLVARVSEVAGGGRLLAVVGPSGSGKSSVVRAGLVPALRAASVDGGTGGWRIATMVPGAAPVQELRVALAAAGSPGLAPGAGPAGREDEVGVLLAAARLQEGGRLLLVIDQLEELFVRTDERTGTHFLEDLLAALDMPGTRAVVVVTLRADFLHVPLALPRVGERFRDATELVTPLSRAELERAIVRPAGAAGVEVEPALVVEIVTDVERRPGVLPLLEYALTELFDRSDGRRLTRDGYAAIGGAIGALGRQADEAWRTLDAVGRDVMRQALLAMVEVGPGGVATGRRVSRAELESLVPADPGRVAAVVDDLGRRGLVTFDVDRATGAATVQLAHEALLVHWARLDGWIEDLRGDLATRRRLADAAADWEAGAQEVDLATGTRLDRFETWARTTRLALTEAERSFLRASIAARRRQSRRRQSLRAAAVVLAAALVLAVGGLGATLAGRAQADVARAQAEAELADVARARELAAASGGTTHELRLLLALRAAAATQARGYVTEEAYDALQWALQDERVPFPSATSQVAGVRAAQDGSRGVDLLAPEVLMRMASDRAARSLTVDECRSYLHEGACPPAEAPVAGLGVKTVAGVVPASSLAVSSLVGTRVTLLSEMPAELAPLLASFEDVSGIGVFTTAAPDGGLLAAAGRDELPDVAIVARPSAVWTAALHGLAVPLDGRVDTPAATQAIGSYPAGLGRARGPDAAVPGQYGLPVAASVDGLLWYPVAAFAAAGYRAPATAAELNALVERVVGDGQVPWCFGVNAVTDDPSETAAAAWVEDLYLGAQGLAGYDRLAAGDALFESPEFHAAVDALGHIVMPSGRVFGGLDSALRTPGSIAGLPMVTLDPPGCWLYRGASTDARALARSASWTPYPLPGAGPRPLLGRIYQVVLLRDRPEARRLVEYLVGESFATEVASTLCDDGLFTLRPVAVPGRCPMGLEAARFRASLASGTFRARLVDAVPGEVGPALAVDIGGYLWRWRTDGMSSATTGFAGDVLWTEALAEGAP